MIHKKLLYILTGHFYWCPTFHLPQMDDVYCVASSSK